MVFIKKFCEIANRDPHLIAVVNGDEPISYGELYEKSRNLALFISQESSSTMIGVFLDRGVDYLISVIAINLLGRTVVPFDINYPPERINQMICALQLKLCLSKKTMGLKYLNTIVYENQVLNVDSSSLFLSGSGDEDLPFFNNSENPAYIIFTSGTTGTPKPILVPYRSLDCLTEWMGKWACSNGTTALYAALGFDVFFQELYSTLCYGGKLLIITNEQKKDLSLLYDKLASKFVTRLFLPTSMLIPFVTNGMREQYFLSGLRQIFVAGEQLKITEAVRKWFSAHPTCQLVNHYGPAETHVVFEHVLEGNTNTWPELPPIGKPTPGSSAYILNDRLNTVSDDEIGTLYISGDCLALGYFGMPTQTNEKFLQYPLNNNMIYNTGDQCLLNSSNYYEFKGRKDRQYKVRGYRVELMEIEAWVIKSEFVSNCYVLPKQLDSHTSLILYYTSNNDNLDISLKLHAYLKNNLPDYMLPSFYEKVPEIPLTQNGKVNIKELPVVVNENRLIKRQYIEPSTEIEAEICRIASFCLGIDKVGASDNFMEAGANSITLINFLSELQHKFSKKIRITDLFEFPCPRELSGMLVTNAGGGKISPARKLSKQKNIRSESIRNIKNMRGI